MSPQVGCATLILHITQSWFPRSSCSSSCGIICRRCFLPHVVIAPVRVSFRLPPSFLTYDLGCCRLPSVCFRLLPDSSRLPRLLPFILSRTQSSVTLFSLLQLFLAHAMVCHPLFPLPLLLLRAVVCHIARTERCEEINTPAIFRAGMLCAW